MPGTFFGFPITAQTNTFLITSDEDNDAKERATAIAGTCESDLSRLEKVFNTNFQTGQTHKYGVWVHVVAPGSGNGASNFGFETSQSSRIGIFGTFAPPPPNAPPDPLSPVPLNPLYIRQEYARFLFVAELAEILMDFTGRKWGRGDSSGEGLSIYLGTLLHPDGYYGAIASPRVNAWLNADRPNQNWVSATEQSDTNTVSHGCALLYLYYLVNQLGHPIEKIIESYPPRLLLGGGTLADAFAKLTGQPASAAFPQFNNLVAKHLPIGQKVFVGHDNIFPLRDPAGRSVSINQTSRMMTNPRGPAESFEVQPGDFCPKKSYDFFRVTETDEYAVYANCRGILNAAFQWRINGIELTTRGKFDSITFPIERSVKTPDGKTAITGHSMTIQYGIIDRWNKSELYIYPAESAEGNCVITVTASVTEAAINDAPVSVNDHVSIDPISFEPSEEYKKDRRRCNPFYARIDDSLYGLSSTLANLKNRPDPPSEQELFQVLEAAARVEHDAQRAGQVAHISRSELFKELQFTGALFSREPRAGDDVLRLVRPKPQETSEQ